MKFLNHIRSKSRLKSSNVTDQDVYSRSHSSPGSAFSSNAPNPTINYPAALLEEIFSYVCAHARDDTYTSCEESMSDGGCMLCDMRDLAQCALVNRQWCQATQNVLYHNIRIDSVHYCDREVELAAKRNRRSFSNGHGNPSQERLQLLSRTVRENHSLGQRIQYLKIPYMTREGSVADLARIVSFTPFIRYVDLPDSFYMDDPSSEILKVELQSRCPQIRHMRYFHGSESSFQALPQFSQWPHLEVIELSHLAVEPSAIAAVLGSLSALREVKLLDLPLLDDTLFESFPPLLKIHLQGASEISIQGLMTYISRSQNSKTLSDLLLTDTGVSASEIHQILSGASNLNTLHITTSVSRALPISKTPLLSSASLKVLYYEISNSNSSPDGLPPASDSYYAYLSTSILSGSLPSLTRLYALSDSPQTLLQPPPQPSSLSTRTGNKPAPLSLGIRQPLQLYTKATPEMEWNITLISPPTARNRRGTTTATRPESVYHAASLSPHYRNAGRDTMVVGNGFGGFLTVPSPSFPPGSPGYRNRKKDLDDWMG
ncbi:hypothetical protein ACLMJK_001249 [Lecanora helva]